jgi:hypothetical protein
MDFVTDLEKQAKRYADLIQATCLMRDGGTYPTITNIGFINKYKSRQHLVLLLALDTNCPAASINFLGSQLESFFFFSNTLGIQAKNNERQFAQWAISLRGLSDIESIAKVIDTTIFPYIREKLGEFRQTFLNLRHSAYSPLYRLRFVLSRMENTLRDQCNLPLQGHDFVHDLQVEHILPQTPGNDVIPEAYAKDADDYKNAVYQLGNVTLLESTINQAVNNFNDLNGTWFAQKQVEYTNSNLLTTNLLNHEYSVGKNTAINRVKADYKYSFQTWGKNEIKERQNILLELAFETWKINEKRIDQMAADVALPTVIASGNT